MHSNVHSEFINKDITCILDDAVNATELTNEGIEMYPLLEYILQAVFLRMTGFLEQKMKCICWSLATNDFEFRRIFLNKNKDQGEYSTYDSKKFVFDNLWTVIRQTDKDYQIKSEDLNALIKSAQEIIESLLLKKLFLPLLHSKELYFEFQKKVSSSDFLQNTEKDKSIVMVSSTISDIYTYGLYVERNRVAHNTRSYQKDLPELNNITEDSKKYHCYLVYFFILIMLDKLFVRLYGDYVRIVGESMDVFY